MGISDIDWRLEELNQEFQELFAAYRGGDGYLKYADTFKRITNDMATLKEKRNALLEQQNINSAADHRIQNAVDILNAGSAESTEWDESKIRQLVDTVKMLSVDRIRVCFQGGLGIEQTIGEDR